MHTLPHVPEALAWLHRQGAQRLVCDSRQVQPGDAFVAWPGAAHDGRRYVGAALQAGAVACLVEQEGADAWGLDDPRVAALAGLKALAGPLAHAFVGDPSAGLPVVAITGTNGKTSTAWWAAQWLQALGRPAAVVGTLGIGRPGGDWQPTGLTTPDPVQVALALRGFVQQGVQAVVMEASSIGIEEARLAGTRVHTAVFTNFTQDHLDYHGSMDAYWQAKRRLFDVAGLRAAVVNLDDPQGLALAAELAPRAEAGALDLWTVSARGLPARLDARALRWTDTGLAFELHEAGQPAHTLAVPVVGDYNVSNLLCAVAVARTLGHGLADAVRVAAALTPVPGRMESAWPEGPVGLPLVLVDYAHTPDALEKALQALQPVARQRGGRLWCVLGCGGDRDRSKRPLMAAAAEREAAHVVLTSDNPRSEDPREILHQMQAGLATPARAQVEPDRALAIALAAAQAGASDVVLLAGKGHEDYQEVAGQRRPFSDRTVAHQALERRAALTALLGGLCGARPVGDLAPVAVQRVHTDTRSLRPGDLFVALRGERFDAHDFLPQARAAGAVAALAERGLALAGVPGVEVPDSRAALGELAALWRARFALPLIAVTGSNGKTTVTQMVASILRAAVGDAALATQGNLNNDIGVPLTVLRLSDAHRLAVVELGMNHPGEIAGLAAIAQPTVALVNNAQREHQEFMATVEAVAHENAACFDALPADGVAVFPHDDAYTALWHARAAGRRCVTFGGAGADVNGDAVWQHGAWQLQAQTPDGPFAARLHIAGRHNVRNALAAAACAWAAGVPLAAMAEGLSSFVPVAGRSRAIALRLDGRELTLVDDSYNANPDSVRAAIDVLAELPGPRLLVLGDMGEVGTHGLAFHDEVLRHALAQGLDHVLVVGDWMQAAAQPLLAGSAGRLQAFAQWDGLSAAALQRLPGVASVLVKGSRFMRTERLVHAIEARASHTLSEGNDHAA